MIHKASALLVALLVALSTFAASTGDAEARRGRNSAFAAGAVLGILGAAVASEAARGRCHRGELRCRWVRGECVTDRYGARECDPGYDKCYRPLYCD